MIDTDFEIQSRNFLKSHNKMTEAKTRNLTALAKSIHEAAKAKGFWDEKRDLGETFMLMISEAAEAMEGHRKGKAADLVGFDTRLTTLSESINLALESDNTKERCFVICFENYIKDTPADELADTAVRCLDYIGHKRISYETCAPDFLEPNYATKSSNFGAQLLKIVGLINSSFDYFDGGDDYYGSVALCNAVSCCFDVAEKNGIDLDRHIELKLKYNATRPYKHGKKY